jgi:hypothetical protein
MKFKLNIAEKVIGLVTFFLCVSHSIQHIFYAGRVRRSSLPSEGSLDLQLSATHFIFLVLLLGYLATLAFKSLLAKVVSLFISAAILGVYTWWYYEKFALLVTEGTEEYNWQISEFGFLRGATTLDYWVFFITLLLVIYAVFTFSYKLLANKAKLK